MRHVTASVAIERRLVLVISAVVFVDTMFYAVIAPLLPTLAHELHLSKLSAGVMTAGYPAGTLLGSLPGGVLAARAGPKSTVIVGLALLASSTIAFALLHDAAALDCARFVEGVGGAFSWAGGLAWIVAETASERRGALIGRALGAAIGGALFGPVIGTLANAIGRPPRSAWSSSLALPLIAATRRLPSSHVRSEQGVRTCCRRSPGAASCWRCGWSRCRRSPPGRSTCSLRCACTASARAPARWARRSCCRRWPRGPSARRPGGCRTAAAGCCRCASASSRPARCCCASACPAACSLLAAVVVAIGGALGGFWAPAMALLSDAAERQGLDHGLAAALMNIAWASGQILGSGAGGAIANAAGDALAMTIAAALCAGTLVLVARAAVVRAQPV